jgi:UDP-GlcNAc:undecaprenyl-phosphate GlcNAc-1-phosphate transferase
VPRAGGVGVALSAIAALALVGTAGRGSASLPLDPAGGGAPLLAGAALVFAVGLWDDLRPVRPLVKLAFQFLAAAAVALGGGRIERLTVAGSTLELGWLALPVTLLWVVGLTNAFNLIDGLDGLATGLGIVAAASCSVLLVLRGHDRDAAVLVALLGAMLGFLPHNLHPARVFLGDCGSLPLGFVLAATSITGWQKGATALALSVPLLIFALPILDTLLAVLRRALRGAAPGEAPLTLAARVLYTLEPDDLHIHHRMLGSGLSHRAAVVVLYAVATALSLVGLLTAQVP